MAQETTQPLVDLQEFPLIAPDYDYGAITETISSAVLTKPTPLPWYAAAGGGLLLVLVLFGAATWLFYKGVGVWGIEIPNGWGFAIVNFVWWIGIGHAGTLISAFLLLMRQKWRQSINRFAEAMTIFAVMCAGMFPLFHLGRPWFFYWLFPYPSVMWVQPQFRSPLVWDVFAVSTYFTVSVIFWYIGMIPDLATMRDRAKNYLVRTAYAVLALGWRGSADHWKHYETASLLLAGLATPLVISVHTVVSFDFTIALVPGWHSTIFPPYFVAGALYSGFAMVLVLVIPVRRLYRMEGLITMRHLKFMGELLLATGWIVLYSYIMEAFFAWYSGSIFERGNMWYRMFGPYGIYFWVLVLFNLLIPQLLWIKRVRTSTVWLFLISLSVLYGMWLERYVIVVQSLTRDYMPSAWGRYSGTIWDYATLAGTIGFFVFCMALFVRTLPMSSMSEIRGIAPHVQAEERA